MKEKPTDEQAAVIEALLKFLFSIIINAKAGTGKSTLVKMVVNAISQVEKGMDIAAFVFNNQAQKELALKLGNKATCKTSHSLCYGVLKQHGKYKIPGKYEKGWLNEEMDMERRLNFKGSRESEDVSEDRAAVKDLIHFTRVTMTDHKDVNAIEAMANARNLKLGTDPKQNIQFASDILREHVEKLSRGSGIIDFDDMIWLPVLWNLTFPQFDLTIVDEAQDTSAMAKEAYTRTIRPGGRILAVGDPFQAIYGFAGADNDSMQFIKDKFDCKEFPLTTNWRCDWSIIEEAKILVPAIRCRPNAPRGKVWKVSVDYFDDNVKLGDMVLCRFNAPLAAICISLIKKGMKAFVKGRDIGAEIGGIVKKVVKAAARVNGDFEATLTDWAENEEDNLKKRRVTVAAIDALWDKVEVIRHFHSDGNSPEEIIDKLEEIFKDRGAGIELSSIHRQKGGEADRVWIININKIRMSRPDMSDQEKQQEFHVEYVAKTRARKEMYYVDLDQEEDYIDLYPEANQVDIELPEIKKPTFEELLKLSK